MSESRTSFVQVAPDSTGKRIRNVAVTRLVDGVEQTEYIQAISVVDEEGESLRRPDEWQAAVLKQLVSMNELLTQILAALG